MALGDRRYRNTVPPEERRLAEASGFGKPNWYVPTGDNPPVYTDFIRHFLRDHRDAILAGGEDSIEATGSNGNGAMPGGHQGEGEA
jgi:hypothetical protein